MNLRVPTLTAIALSLGISGPARADFIIVRGYEAGRGYDAMHAVHCDDPGCQPEEICLRGGEGDSLRGCFMPDDHPACITYEDCPPLPHLGEIVEIRCLGGMEPGFFGVCEYIRAREDPSACELTLSFAGDPCFGAEGWVDGDCDSDGVANSVDNCLCNANPDQRDCDGDGVGAACTLPPREEIAPLAELCPEATSYEETRCQGRWCGCRGILAADDPWCGDPACVALPSVADSIAVCPRTIDAGVDGGVDAGTDAGADAGWDAGADAGMPMDAGTVPNRGGCAASPGSAPMPFTLLALLALRGSRRRRRESPSRQ